MAALVGNDQGALELSGPGLVDAKIRGQLHRATHAPGNVDKRAVTEHRAVERRIVIVLAGHHATQVLAHQFRMRVHRFGNRAEDDSGLRQFAAESRGYRDRVKHRVHGNPRQHLLLVQRYAQLGVGLQQLGVHFIQALGAVLHTARRGVIGHGVQVNGGIVHMGPLGLFHLPEAAIGLQSPLQQPVRLAFLLRYELNDLLVQAGSQCVRIDGGHETRRVFPVDGAVYVFLRHVFTSGGRCTAVCGIDQLLLARIPSSWLSRFWLLACCFRDTCFTS